MIAVNSLSLLWSIRVAISCTNDKAINSLSAKNTWASKKLMPRGRRNMATISGGCGSAVKYLRCFFSTAIMLPSVVRSTKKWTNVKSCIEWVVHFCVSHTNAVFHVSQTSKDAMTADLLLRAQHFKTRSIKIYDVTQRIKITSEGLHPRIPVAHEHSRVVYMKSALLKQSRERIIFLNCLPASLMNVRQCADRFASWVVSRTCRYCWQIGPQGRFNKIVLFHRLHVATAKRLHTQFHQKG